MLVMLDMTLTMEFVLLPQLTAHQDNSDTMEFVMHHAQSELVLKETIVKELAQLVLGLITMAATEHAQLNLPLMMLVLNLAQLEQPFKTESVKFHLKAVPMVNSSMLLHLHADPAKAHALNALLLLLIALPALQASP